MSVSIHQFIGFLSLVTNGMLINMLDEKSRINEPTSFIGFIFCVCYVSQVYKFNDVLGS